MVVASPARPDDAAAMLRTCLAAAAVDGEVCVFLEPIALYHTRDLHRGGRQRLARAVPAAGRWAETHVPIGRARTYGDGARPHHRDVRQRPADEPARRGRGSAAEGYGCRVLDLRWLTPLPVADLLRGRRLTGRVLIADETRRSGGVSESVAMALIDGGFTGRIARVTSCDSFVPLGAAADLVLLSEAEIEEAARKLLG